MSENVSSKQVKENKLIGFNILIALILTIFVFLLSLSFREMKFAPDQGGASWYYWKLTNPTWLTRTSVWAGYILHQIAVWWIILKMRKSKQGIASGLTKYNKQLIAVNLVFILVHYIQSAIWYDGLAQDVSVWSSQYSVIVMLVLILIIENKRRGGLFFGKKSKVAKRRH